MFKRILIPTDGSKLSEATIKAGVNFAKTFNATVVGFHATEIYSAPYYTDFVPANFMTQKEYEKKARQNTVHYLNVIKKEAEKAKLNYEGYAAETNAPSDAIVETAKKRKCDIIFIGSHGRTGLQRFFLGGVTTKVLSKCDIPVLVYRSSKRRKSR